MTAYDRGTECFMIEYSSFGHFPRLLISLSATILMSRRNSSPILRHTLRRLYLTTCIQYVHRPSSLPHSTIHPSDSRTTLTREIRRRDLTRRHHDPSRGIGNSTIVIVPVRRRRNRVIRKTSKLVVRQLLRLVLAREEGAQRAHAVCAAQTLARADRLEREDTCGWRMQD